MKPFDLPGAIILFISITLLPQILTVQLITPKYKISSPKYQMLAPKYEILAIFPTPFYSHMTPVAPILELLAQRGHKIVLITPYPIALDRNTSENIIQIDIKFEKARSDWALRSFDIREEFDWMSIGLMSSELIRMGDQICDDIFKHPVVRTILKSTKFDTVMFEHFGGMAYQAIAKWHNSTLIGISPTEATDHRKMGNFEHFLFHPSDTIARYFGHDGNYSLMQRLKAYLYGKWESMAIGLRLSGGFDLWSKYFVNITYWDVHMDLQICNAHPAMGFQRPIQPNTLQLGFLHIRPTQPLPDYLADYLDSSSRGVIYVTFGSILNNDNIGDPSIFDMSLFQSVLSHLDYDIMFTWSGELNDKADNVQLFKWLPQQDVIAHKNVKLVICHGGLQTIEEAIWFGKPVLNIPFWGDHHANSLRAEELGVAKTLLRSTMTADSLEHSINDLLNDPT